ncbi:MAG TPA: hypothetical protein ENJ82_10600 [Bacteroidetes bacterium]|nr:hypothetical protein [Bacteroidota bacterium]
MTIHDQQGKLIYTTTYLTNVQPMNVGEWSAVMPFEIKVRHRNAAKMKAFRAITKGHSEGIYTFKMAYVKFTDGPTLDEYWLSPDQ